MTIRSDSRRHAADIPHSTYRLQFNKHFKFTQAAGCVAYLQQLGISYCYASPFLKARPGSVHGYDIVDHNTLNPEIGSEEDFDYFVSVLDQAGMGLIADIVPNHMGVMGSDNGWWLDVLENGPASGFARFFDIDWHPVKKVLENKILIPVLADHYGNILDKQQLKLVFDADLGEFSVYYFQHRFPIDPQTYPKILCSRHERLLPLFAPDDAVLLEYQTLENSFSKLPLRTEISAQKIEERARDKEVFKRQLAGLCSATVQLTRFIQSRVTAINREASARSELHDLLESQAYRLACWRVAGDEINYRRFFDINDLAGLRVEDETVFNATHRLLLNLVEQGKLQGLRIDHADGLHDPVAYYRRLNQAVAALLKQDENRQSPPLYLIAEKVVANYEYLASGWPIHGTTGYEFAAIVNGIFVDCEAEHALTRTYVRFIGQRLDLDEMVYQAKKFVMTTSLASELNMLANQLSKIAEAGSKTRDYTLNALRDALMETIACFPVYRTYINCFEVSKQDTQYIDWAIRQGQQRSRSFDKTVFGFIRRTLLLDTQNQEVAADKLLNFVMKFQQVTAPVMAKGLEDTALYQYHRLISLNEVGSDPRRFGCSVNAFHHFNQERLKKWPYSLLCLSSHDTKRSADVRARINILSEIPQQWQAAVVRWRKFNRVHRRVSTPQAITRNDEYLFYQTLIGTWPFRPMNDPALIAYRQRIASYMLKAVREAKQYSSWLNPDTDYEHAVTLFVERCLHDPQRSLFLQDFMAFERRVRPAGLYNALAQTLLLLTSPGVPDIYQGNELWQFALVDPDNRRPVDFNEHARLLLELDETAGNDRFGLLKTLLENMEDGRIKLFMMVQTLRFRNRYAALFSDGEYVKINSRGLCAAHLLAFARKNRSQWVIVVVPRLNLSLSLSNNESRPLSADLWQDTWLELPADGPLQYWELFSQRQVRSQQQQRDVLLAVSDVFRCFPCAVLAAC